MKYIMNPVRHGGRLCLRDTYMFTCISRLRVNPEPKSSDAPVS